MGIRRIISRGGAQRTFPKFSKGGQKKLSLIFPLEIKKTTFFCWEFQSPGDLAPPDPPSDAHAR